MKKTLAALAVLLAFASSSEARAQSISVTDLNGSGSVDCAGACAGNTYNLTGASDALALLYGGLHHNGTRDCNSDARRALVAQWGQLYPATCHDGCPNGLHHAWRSNDLSPVTTAFLASVGLASMPSATLSAPTAPIDFCNAYSAPATARHGGDADFLDNDPIRVPCDATDQVCRRDHTLGLVLPISPPPPNDVAQKDAYTPTFCTSGNAQVLAPGPTTGFTGICPSGQQAFGGGCFAFVDGDGGANCLTRNLVSNQPFLTPNLPDGTLADGRASNLWPRFADQKLFRETTIGRSRPILGAFYRIHSTRSQSGVTCQEATAKDQQDCLGLADPASATLAYAGSLSPSTISTCTNITSAGTYVLGADLATFQSAPCLSIANTNGVTLDCAGHSVTSGNISLSISNTTGFSVKNCTFLGSGFGEITGSSDGVFAKNTIGTAQTAGLVLLAITHSNRVATTSNVVFGTVSYGHSINGLIFENQVTCVANTCAGSIQVQSGSGNQVLKNVIEGRGKWTNSGPIGGDDGVLVVDENHDVISDNQISNFFDCGIETLGVVSFTTMARNQIRDTSYCGIGGWYWSSIRNSVFAGNDIRRSARGFRFTRAFGLRAAGWDGEGAPADDGVYFSDNVFDGNLFAETTVSSGTGSSIPFYLNGALLAYIAGGNTTDSAPTAQQFHLQNNAFKNNDFGATLPIDFGTAPYSGAVVDQGNNTCLGDSTGQLSCQTPPVCNGVTINGAPTSYFFGSCCTATGDTKCGGTDRNCIAPSGVNAAPFCQP